VENTKQPEPLCLNSAFRNPHSALELGPMERLALSWGNARQFTKLLLSLLSHIGGVG
jgi:hypothetical protein